MTTTDPPLRVAWRQALAGIAVRFGRHLVTAAGIALGIAFFASVMVVRQAGAAADDPQGPVRLQWLVATSLAMCLVGVSNSMLMSVTERFREIGTIKCLGASDGFIVKVFFIEAVLLGALGSTAGALVGASAMAGVQAVGGSPIGLGRWAAIVASGVALGLAITVAAAVAPAFQAARMPAAAALRMDI